MDRKCLPLFVVFVMIFTLSGCGPAEEPVNTAEEQEPASTAEEPVQKNLLVLQKNLLVLQKNLLVLQKKWAKGSPSPTRLLRES